MKMRIIISNPIKKYKHIRASVVFHFRACGLWLTIEGCWTPWLQGNKCVVKNNSVVLRNVTTFCSDSTFVPLSCVCCRYRRTDSTGRLRLCATGTQIAVVHSQCRRYTFPEWAKRGRTPLHYFGCGWSTWQVFRLFFVFITTDLQNGDHETRRRLAVYCLKVYSKHSGVSWISVTLHFTGCPSAIAIDRQVDDGGEPGGNGSSHWSHHQSALDKGSTNQGTHCGYHIHLHVIHFSVRCFLRSSARHGPRNYCFRCMSQVCHRGSFFFESQESIIKRSICHVP